MNEPVPHVPDLILLAIPVFVLSIAAEAAYLAHLRREQRDQARLRGYALKDSAASISMGLGNVAVNLVWKGIAFGLYTALYQLTPLRMGFGVLAWAAVLFADDFAYYWFHRVHHESRLFWASHVIHHSSQHYNLSTAVRQTWTPFTAWAFWAPLAMLGFHPVLIVTANSISLLYQFFIHTEAVDKLGPLEWVLNTPSHHRVHHGSNPRYLDKNYGGILIVWDRLFGTFQAELAEDPPVYGLTRNLRTFNPVRIAFAEYGAIARDVTRARTWRERVGRALRNPAWQPAPVAAVSARTVEPGAARPL
jgi:sterol desaturase/sphingolipid hydroxylase (fatty acid hydroxylase superfamily)